MKKYLVVAYDIADDRRRTKISNILSEYGERVNYSVFECLLNEKEIQELKTRISAALKKSQDRVVYYYLCRSCLLKIEREGVSLSEGSVVEFF